VKGLPNFHLYLDSGQQRTNGHVTNYAVPRFLVLTADAEAECAGLASVLESRLSVRDEAHYEALSVLGRETSGRSVVVL
jgi:hypothetical protein